MSALHSDLYGPCDGCGHIDRLSSAEPLLGPGQFCDRCIHDALTQEQNG